jgi:hypothetical protein
LKYVSPSHSIADSPYGNYPDNANTTITSVANFDLSDAVAVFVEFHAQWDIEAGYDYVQFLVSENNGSTWVPQNGTYTRLGSQYQDYGKPLYDGLQTSWVKEMVNLNQYIGKNVKFRFRLMSDLYVNADGFYFDDFALKVMYPQKAPPVMFFPDTISYFDTDIFHEFSIFNYVIPNDPGNLTVRWEGEENFIITYNDATQFLHITTNEWTGCETVTFFIENIYGESQQDVVLECINTKQLPQLNFPDTISFLDTDIFYQFHILDYVAPNSSETLTVQWEGEENFIITYNDATQFLHITTNEWTGCETVTFIIGNENGEARQDVVIECIKSANIPAFENNTNAFFAYYNAETKKIIIKNVEKPTPFSLFNVEGKLLDSFIIDNTYYEVNASNLQTGVYFLKTNFGDVRKIAVY